MRPRPNSCCPSAGFENVTAAERAAAARALGITVPAWRAGQHVYFDLAARGSVDSNPCVPCLAAVNHITYKCPLKSCWYHIRC